MAKFKLALLCGGPSLERGISLNSARTILDHLQSDKIEILPVYFDYAKRPYLISRAQLYSNTPSDFDFKLKQASRPLKSFELINLLKRATITFPVIHGRFGEDGQIQKFLEENGLPFIGSPSKACRLAFDKFNSANFIKQHGFAAMPSQLLLKKNYRQNHRLAKNFFLKYKIKQAIVKPANGGSSIAVYQAENVADAIKSAEEIFSKNIDQRVIIEPFCRGREFTVIILENRFGQPVAILPTEIELAQKNKQIFDYRKKYLATNQVRYHCPPKFSDRIINEIQTQAQDLFRLFGLKDFARFDGWLMPDGKIYFSDFNPVSGMEQNSFLFMQSSRLGFSHGDFLNYILANACRRQKISFPAYRPLAGLRTKKKKVQVIFGGRTAERQVSVMSGTNVWLKLKKSLSYDAQPFLLDLDNHVWRLPYTLTLNHTVEEIAATCRQANSYQARLADLRKKVLARLRPEKNYLNEPWFLPEKMSLKKFIDQSSYVFIGLHGGFGENGGLQKLLEQAGKPFNGSGSLASKLCLDKPATGKIVSLLENRGVTSAKRIIVKTAVLKKISGNENHAAKYWRIWQKKLGSTSIIAKPTDDGCSAGIARLYNFQDLHKYAECVVRRAGTIEKNNLTNQTSIIEMPHRAMKKIMLEEYITTDKTSVNGNRLVREKQTGWIEITCGLVEKRGVMRAFNPSLTVAAGDVLSLEEKFQGGTGINITPLPARFVRTRAIKSAKTRFEAVAKELNLKGYARIDAFMDIGSGRLIIIEANTLPGLTPSTVIFHQALAEKPPLYPLAFIEKIIGAKY